MVHANMSIPWGKPLSDRTNAELNEALHEIRAMAEMRHGTISTRMRLARDEIKSELEGRARVFAFKLDEWHSETLERIIKGQ